ncbi:MAG: isochorismatase family protein [Deltaproteobacteria bacterium]|nr:isochorismatase family protein [Deltaproteobacteria bacterium]
MFDPAQHQLVVIDFQERLFAAMPEPQRDRALKATGNLLYLARALGMPVCFTEQYPQGLGPTVPSLAATEPLVKNAFAATDEEGFFPRLADRRVVILAGMETHICVAHTATGLLASGYQVIVAADACVSRQDADWNHGLAWVKDAGATVLPSETILFGLLGRAGGPHFKEVSRRIR